VGRYLLQDALGRLYRPLADPANLFANTLCSALMVAGWGFFLLNGVADPEGGTKALWPIFGIANQLLASIALGLGTLILLKKQLASPTGRPQLALITAIPLVWLLTVTVSAAVEKIGHPDPRIGFLAAARKADSQLGALQKARDEALPETPARAAAEKALRSNRTLSANMRTDAAVTAGFLALVAVLLGITAKEAILLLRRRKEPTLSETEPVWIPLEDSQSSGVPVLGIVTLSCALAHELSGEAAVERERQIQAAQCVCASPAKVRSNAFLLSAERRFQGVQRCC
jgi:carbon starvation protein